MAWSKILSSLFFFGVFMVVFAAPRRRFASREELEEHCSYVYNKTCTDDIECQCDFKPIKLICNYKKVCDQTSIVDIMRRLPCPNTFKKACRHDEDCNSCSGLVCEENECVNQKNIIT